MLKIRFTLAAFFIILALNCYAGIVYSKYDMLVDYYENNIDKTHLKMLEDARKSGITYQEFFDFIIMFTDFDLFSFGGDCKNYPNEEVCLKKIAKVEASISVLEFFAKYDDETLDTNIFKKWKEKALKGVSSFDFSEHSKDSEYLRKLFDKLSSPTPK